MKYKIRINPVAISDVQQIKAYIAEDNSEAASKMGAAIYSRIERLADFPEMGISLSSKISIKTDYRFVICGSYLIFYKVEGEFTDHVIICPFFSQMKYPKNKFKLFATKGASPLLN